jgi:5-(carboxyamino)imidazole ribonucleotide synthase
MVGAGQLARMTHQAAIALGQSLRVLAASPGDPAALVAADVRPGRADDLAAVRAFAAGCAAVTFDHEQVPQDVLRALARDGVAVHPGPDALLFAQDKLVMRRRLAELGVPVPAFAEVTAPERFAAFAAEHGRVVLKAVRGGYDGRGVWMDPDAALVAELLAAGTPLMVEAAVPLRRELAALVARSPYGRRRPGRGADGAGGRAVRAGARPGPDLDEERATGAQRLALQLAGELGVTGLLAVELFEDERGRVLVNELAMRPHNSGHWTIEGSRTSQFEQHLRRGPGLPAGRDRPDGAGRRHGERARRGAGAGDGARRALPPPVRPVPGREGAPVRQGGAAAAQGRARHRARRGHGGRAGARGAGGGVAVDRGVDGRVVDPWLSRRQVSSRWWAWSWAATRTGR